MILDDLIDGLVNLFYGIVYKIFSSICSLIDFIKTIFFKLCGIETVEIDGSESDLLTNLVESDSIKRVFLTITIIGIILLVVFTIIALIKSNYQEKQNWKTVMSKTLHAFIIMFILPLTIISGIILANVVMSSINQAMQANLVNGNATIGGQFLVTIGHDSFKFGSGAIKEEIETMFISGSLDYNKLSVVKQYYDITNMNYIIGLIGGIVMLVMFVLSALTFIQRIFDVILLYVVSPVMVSTIPLDEGNRFKVWKDMLISKILSAYGVILVMNLFFLIIPQINQINFFNNDFHNGIVYILFLIGGSFAVTKASRVIAQLCGSQPTGGELAQMIYNIRSGLALSKATTAVVGGVVGGIVGGSDYNKLRKQGKTQGEALNASIHSTRNQRVVAEGQKKNKTKQVVGAPFRLATLPLGMLNDLSKGGLIQVGKNFIPRLKNLFGGDTLVNRADIVKKVQPVVDEGIKKNGITDVGADLNNTTGEGNIATQDLNTETDNIISNEVNNDLNTDNDDIKKDSIIDDDKKGGDDDENNT